MVKERMSTPTLDQPFRPTTGFWVAYLALSIPVLWFAAPWKWELPIYAQVAGAVFLPFAATVVLYCPYLFAVAVLRGDSKQRQIARAFFSATLGAAALLFVIWWIRGFPQMPWLLVALTVTLANVLFGTLQRKKPDQRSQPMRANGPHG
jgi:hypothetical protein